MKSGGIQRGVHTGATSRKPGSAPGLGKVARTPGFGRPGTRRNRRHRQEQLRRTGRRARKRARRLIIVVWSIVIGLVSTAALGVAFASWLRPMLKREKDTTETDRVAADALVRVASKFKSPTEQEALALVKKALELRNPDEVAGLIRPGPMTALEVVNYLEAMKSVDGEIAGYVWLRSIDKNGLSLEGVLVKFVVKNKPRSRLAILTPDASGVWKMDFAAFARLVQPSWPDLLTRKAESGIVRVYVTKDSYYNGPFLDDTKFTAYSLASPDMDEVLVGYCKVDSAQDRAMKLMWTGGSTPTMTRATLEIRRVEGAEQRQYEISRVLAEDWVMAEKPLDEGR
ncbi:MAG: hypothetical protein NTW21_16375 [Verrucomicrobia bacterium]|nr:hypothetical protein [Verrucomicrobiota bacterium]